MKRNDSLQRRPPRRAALPRVLIVCEGIVTERVYFQSLRHVERIPIDLQIVAGGTPKTLVAIAAKMKREADRAAEKSGDPNLRFEEVWCVFDVDEHPYLPEAKQQAIDNGIQVALSNPCFELWVLLHFRKQTSHIERHKVQRACRDQLPKFKKELSYEALLDKYFSALGRARELDRLQRLRGKAEGNPYTGVFLLAESLKAFRG